jgi:Na+/proline symporter
MMYIGGLFYGTAVFFPMILALYWKRGTSEGAIAAIVVSVALGLYSEFYLSGKAEGILGIPSNLLAAMAGLATFIIVSLATKSPTTEQLAVITEKRD